MYIEETHSTSSLLRESYTDALPHLYTIRTDYQTAGRGQAGNGWESERAKNLLFSSLLRYPTLLAAEQWRISMLVAVAVREVLSQELAQYGGEEPTIKWPNDIYYGDHKLVGILIENMLQGAHIAYTIAGVGINVNQTKWLSNAPNPISLQQITGKEHSVDRLMQAFVDAMVQWENQPTEVIYQAYMQHLYRKTGWYPYVEREVNLTPTAIQTHTSNDAFEAQIVDVTPQGELQLLTRNGETKKYHFKQIRYIIQKT